MNGWVSLVAVAAQLIVAGVCSEASTAVSQWHKLQWQCLDESNAAMRAEAESKVECLANGVGVSGDLVAQWNSDTGVCCVFHYQQVCRLASAAASAVCHVFGRFGITPWSLSSKFVGVWVFGNSEKRLDNRMCSSSDPGKNRFHASNIGWSAEGATFNGVDSYMLMNDTEFMSFSDGFTWLLRLKRQPRMQPWLEAVPCDDYVNFAMHLWEFDYINKLWFNAESWLNPNVQVVSVNFFPNDANAWINIGVVSSDSGNFTRIFADNSFVEEGRLSFFHHAARSPSRPSVCLLLGRRWTDARLLHGTVAAVGIANAAMTEAEIRHFFSQLPT